MGLQLYRRNCNYIGGTVIMEEGLQLHRIDYSYAKGAAAMAAAITQRRVRQYSGEH